MVVDSPTIMVTLQDDAELLSEVVVIGYGSVKKNDLTGSVTAIKAEEINRGAILLLTKCCKVRFRGC